jgi:hypothetical protein
MHSPVNKPGTLQPELQLAAALAKHLLSPSRFENTAATSKSAAQDGLRCLAALGTTTRLSLPAVTPSAVTLAEPVPSAQPVTPPAQAAAQPVATRFGSHKQEYQTGLRDNTVIEALLEFHARTRSSKAAAQAPLAGFSKQQILEVAAQPKKPVAHQPGTTRVFRNRGF